MGFGFRVLGFGIGRRLCVLYRRLRFIPIGSIVVPFWDDLRMELIGKV